MVFFPDEENKSKVVEGKATDSNKKDDSCGPSIRSRAIRNPKRQR